MVDALHPQISTFDSPAIGAPEDRRTPRPGGARPQPAAPRLLPASSAGIDRRSASTPADCAGSSAPRADLSRLTALHTAGPAPSQAKPSESNAADRGCLAPPALPGSENAALGAAGSTTRYRLAAYCAPTLDTVAAGLSLGAINLTVHPLAAKFVNALSGAFWFTGAAASEVGNTPYSASATGANLLGAAAGALCAATPFIFGTTQSRMAYASAGTWAANGTATLWRAAVGGSPAASRFLQGIGGAANLGAAALAAASVKASAHNDSAEATRLGTASSVLWAIAAAAQAGSVWAGRSGTHALPFDGNPADAAV